MDFARNGLIVSFLVVFSAFVCADTYYVDVDVSGGAGDGSSWENAFDAIGDAIGVAGDYDEIIVAEGIYEENIDLDGLSILLRSTDPNDPEVVAATIIDGANSGRVVTCESDESGEMVDTVINGFTIQNGLINGNAGGIYCKNSSPTIMNCVIIDNIANGSGFGGGIFCWGGGPTILSCKFFGNDGDKGSGLSCYQSDAIVDSCVFSGNVGANLGGGLYLYESDAMITNCTFSQNQANFGGAIYSYINNSVIKNCVMWGNSAATDDEIYLYPGTVLSLNYCTIEGGWSGSGSNNYSFDPSFNDPDGLDDTPGTADDDLSVHPFSLCINMGDPAGDYEGLVDMDGQKRLAYGQVDIGADEVFPIGGDLFVDEIVDVQDLAIFVDEQWLVDADLSDFALLAEQWMYGAEVIE